MARKFVDLEEAAQILGVTPDTLSEMRDRREVHGYRDGSSWKFKQEDIERVKADRDAAREEGEFAELDEDPDSILLSEVELGASGESTSSTIIGGKSGKANSPDSDIQLAQPKHDSNVDLDAPLVSEDQAGGSDVLAAGATAVVRRPFSPGAMLRLLDSSLPADGSFRVRPLPIDLGRLRVDGVAPRIWVDGVEQLIPAMEYVLVRYLAERHGEIVTREELVSAGWGERATVPSNSLSVHLARLRRRFPPDAGDDWIRPVRGIGYQFIVASRVYAQHGASGS